MHCTKRIRRVYRDANTTHTIFRITMAHRTYCHPGDLDRRYHLPFGLGKKQQKKMDESQKKLKPILRI